MSRTRRFLSGVGLGYTYQILVVAVGIWLTPFLIGHLGTTNYGFWVVGLQLMFYLSLLDLGVVGLTPREIAFSSGLQDAGELPQLTSRIMTLCLYQTPLVMIAALVAWWLLPSSWLPLRTPIGFAFAVFAITFPFRMFRALLEGLQDMAFLGHLQIASWMAGTAVTVFLVSSGTGLLAVSAGWAVTYITTIASCFVRLRVRYPTVIRPGLPSVRWAQVRDYMGRAMWFSVGQIAQNLMNGSEILIIGYIMGPVALVVYTCTAKLITVLSNQPQLMMQVAQPGLSELRATADREKIRYVAGALTQTMLLTSGAFACVTWVVNPLFVTWWVGAGTFGGSWLTGLLVLQSVLRHWNVGNVYSVFCFGYERHLSLTSLAEGVVTAVACFYLVSAFGLIGAPLASIIAVLVISLPRNLRVLVQELQTTIRELTVWIRPLAVRSILTCITGSVLVHLTLPATFPAVVAAAVFTAAVYGALVVPMSMRLPIFSYVRSSLNRFGITRGSQA